MIAVAFMRISIGSGDGDGGGVGNDLVWQGQVTFEDNEQQNLVGTISIRAVRLAQMNLLRKF